MKKIVFSLVAAALSVSALSTSASAHMTVLQSPVQVIDVQDVKLTPLPRPHPLPFPFGVPIPLPRPIPLPDPCLSCPPMPLDHFPGARTLIIR